MGVMGVRTVRRMSSSATMRVNSRPRGYNGTLSAFADIHDPDHV